MRGGCRVALDLSGLWRGCAGAFAQRAAGVRHLRQRYANAESRGVAYRLSADGYAGPSRAHPDRGARRFHAGFHH